MLARGDRENAPAGESPHTALSVILGLVRERVSRQMSITAPWLALAADWFDSPMWEPMPGHPEPATMGERLAWIALLCHAKLQGRAGKVTVRKNAFVRSYGLSMRALEGMLSRAQKCAALDVNGDVVTICNWRTYQDKAFKAKALNSPLHDESGKSPENSTTITIHPSHITEEVPPSHRTRTRATRAGPGRTPHAPETEPDSARAGGMDAWDGLPLPDALARAGIRGPNHRQLAASTLTTAQVHAEFRSVSADPSVRDVPAVLTPRLFALAGLELSRGGGRVGKDPLLGRLESLRRHRT